MQWGNCAVTLLIILQEKNITAPHSKLQSNSAGLKGQKHVFLHFCFLRPSKLFILIFFSVNQLLSQLRINACSLMSHTVASQLGHRSHQAASFVGRLAKVLRQKEHT